jgi:hypothetical protein
MAVSTGNCMVLLIHSFSFLRISLTLAFIFNDYCSFIFSTSRTSILRRCFVSLSSNLLINCFNLAFSYFNSCISIFPYRYCFFLSTSSCSFNIRTSCCKFSAFFYSFLVVVSFRTDTNSLEERFSTELLIYLSLLMSLLCVLIIAIVSSC